MNNDTKIRHYWLYVLKCEEGKYYVGITSRTPEARFKDHLDGRRPAYWTMRYKPIDIIFREDLGFITEEKAKRRENRTTRAALKKWGLNNVRGGDLTETTKYMRFFGYILLDREMFWVLLGIMYMVISFSAFFIDKYVYPFIPGGIR